MFFLEIKPASQPITLSSDTPGQTVRTMQFGTLNVGIVYSKLYTVVHEFDGKLIVGESLLSIDAERCRRAVAQLAAGTPNVGIPDDDIFFLAVVDGSRGSCTLYNSITNARSYVIKQSATELAVATSPRELHAHGYALQFSDSAKPEYLIYRAVAPPRTHFSDTQRLPAGQHYKITIGNPAQSHTGVYWYFNEKLSKPRDPNEGIAEIGEILQREVSRILKQAKRPAALSSGGVDSSLLTVMCAKTHSNIPTYTTSFSRIDPNDGEIPYAKSVADHLQLPSIAVPPTAEEYLAGLIDTIAETGEPLDHLQTVLLHLLYKRAAADGCDLLVCGQMADLLFGDATFTALHKYETTVNLLQATRLNVALRWLQQTFSLEHGRVRFLSYDLGENSDNPHHLLWTLYRYADWDALETLFGVRKQVVYAGRAELIRHYRSLPLYDRITAVNFLGQAPVPLGQWSRAAEENGLLFFYPFLSIELMKYLFSLPWKHRMAWNTVEPKYALRTLLRNYGFPDTLINRPKQSFGFSFKHWALPNSLFQPIVDMTGERHGKEKLRALQDGNPGRAMLLWTLLNVYLWEQLFTNRRSAAELSGEILDRRRRSLNK